MAEYYHKRSVRNKKRPLKLLSFGVVVVGAIIFAYTFFPLISWQIYFAPAFASSKIQSPIPSHSVINPQNLGALLANATGTIGTDFTNAYNWYPGAQKSGNFKTTYKISIPKIGIEDAVVSNVDMDLTRHMVQYNFDTAPPKEGNSIIFGHSTLPQLYNPKDYKTILANAYKLGVGDNIVVETESVKYNYKVESVVVVDPLDTSVLSQNFSDSFITIITCTPPGTVWKRLVIKARLQNL